MSESEVHVSLETNGPWPNHISKKNSTPYRKPTPYLQKAAWGAREQKARPLSLVTIEGYTTTSGTISPKWPGLSNNFPQYCPTFNVRPSREAKYALLANYKGYPLSRQPTYSLLMPAASYQDVPKSSLFSH